MTPGSVYAPSNRLAADGQAYALEKELNESHVWLRVIGRADVMNAGRIEQLIDENQQLCRIINASVTTAKRNNDK